MENVAPEKPKEEPKAVEPPRGMYPGRLDDKGRLKLPVKFQEYFRGFEKEKIFVTSLDRHIACLYPMPNWRDNEKFFRENRTELVKAVAFNAQDLGAEAEVDEQGRVLFPPELRRELGIEGQPLKLYAVLGRIEVLSEALYEERRRKAQQKVTPEALEGLELKGLS